MNYKLTMRFRPFISFLLLLVTLGGLSACKKKKPALPPPQAQVPTIILPLPEPLPPPPTTPEPNRPQPENVPATVNNPPVKKHPRVTKKPQQPPATAQAPQPQPEAHRSAEDTQLTATNNPQEALHQQLNTTQLLDATENNLKTLTRSLNTDEQAMIQHIRSYMQQSRTALDQKDFERAYNLAYKARLLSDELIKH
jgi:outer membrane biosynthesis protein TonB